MGSGVSSLETLKHTKNSFRKLSYQPTFTQQTTCLTRSSVGSIAALQLAHNLLENQARPFNPSRDGVVVLERLDTSGSSNHETESQKKSTKRPQLSIMVKDYSFNGNANAEQSSSEHKIPDFVPRKSIHPTGKKVHYSPNHGSLSIGKFTINKRGLRTGEGETIPYSFLLQGMSDFVVVNKLGTGAIDTPPSPLPEFPPYPLTQVPLEVSWRPFMCPP